MRRPSHLLLGPERQPLDAGRNADPGTPGKSQQGRIANTGQSEPCFRVASGMSAERSTTAAMRELAAQLNMTGDAGPDFLSLHYGGGRAASEVWSEAYRLFSPSNLHGGSSCLGVMSERGAAIEHGDAIGAFAIWDAKGDYGSASAILGTTPREAAARATRDALQKAGRVGEAPDIVWLTAAPGTEEAVLRGIKDIVGRHVLILGGSSADNDVTGNWSQLTTRGPATDAVVISVLFPSAPVGCCFESGYAPTGERGTVSKTSGRSVGLINGQPAANVYSEWTGGRIAAPREGSASILKEATMCPLGRKSGEIEGITTYMLAHPSAVHADGSVDFFADIPDGEEVWLMTGSRDTLVERAGRIAAGSRAQHVGNAVAGALMVYCGGCMLAVTDRMGEVAESVAEALDGAPFLGVFSFGEQGETLCGNSEHGNLMISCIAFGAEEATVSQSESRG